MIPTKYTEGVTCEPSQVTPFFRSSHGCGQARVYRRKSAGIWRYREEPRSIVGQVAFRLRQEPYSLLTT